MDHKSPCPQGLYWPSPPWLGPAQTASKKVFDTIFGIFNTLRLVDMLVVVAKALVIIESVTIIKDYIVSVYCLRFTV